MEVTGVEGLFDDDVDEGNLPVEEETIEEDFDLGFTTGKMTGWSNTGSYGLKFEIDPGGSEAQEAVAEDLLSAVKDAVESLIDTEDIKFDNQGSKTYSVDMPIVKRVRGEADFVLSEDSIDFDECRDLRQRLEPEVEADELYEEVENRLKQYVEDYHRVAVEQPGLVEELTDYVLEPVEEHIQTYFNVKPRPVIHPEDGISLRRGLDYLEDRDDVKVEDKRPETTVEVGDESYSFGELMRAAELVSLGEVNYNSRDFEPEYSPVGSP
ncbi:MAG: hypothetical protein ACLFRK_00225 [Candidatus Nanohaloarchaea archaeon]